MEHTGSGNAQDLETGRSHTVGQVQVLKENEIDRVKGSQCLNPIPIHEQTQGHSPVHGLQGSMVAGQGLFERSVPVAQTEETRMMQGPPVVVHPTGVASKKAAGLDQDNGGIRSGGAHQLAQGLRFQIAVVVQAQDPTVTGSFQAQVSRSCGAEIPSRFDQAYRAPVEGRDLIATIAGSVVHNQDLIGHEVL